MTELMHSPKSWTERLVAQYIRDQYVNAGRRLISPEARQELLLGAFCYVSHADTTTPTPAFSNKERTVPTMNPFQFGAYGELIAPVYMPNVPVCLRLVNLRGEEIAVAVTESPDFEV